MIAFRHAMSALTLAIAVIGAAAQAADLVDVPMRRDGPATAQPWRRYADWTKGDWSRFNTLADTTRSPPAPAHEAYQPLPVPFLGDAEKGRKLAFSRDRGSSCVTCHVMGTTTPEMPGNIGPDLSEVATIGHSDSYLFNYVFDPRATNPASVMLPWGRHGFFSADEIADIVAFLKTLKTPATFANPLDDPSRRQIPTETRDWTDPFVNPANAATEVAGEMYGKPGPNGKSCASCHATPEATFQRWAATMPKWDSGMKRVIGVEEFVTRHAFATTGADWPMETPTNVQFAVYLRALANNQAIDVDIGSPGAREAFARGQALISAKIGQLNLSCQDCHSTDKGGLHWMRGQWLGLLKGQIGHFPTWRTSRDETWDIRKRLAWCNVQIRANDLPPDAQEYGDLELYLTAISKGTPIEVPGIRH